MDVAGALVEALYLPSDKRVLRRLLDAADCFNGPGSVESSVPLTQEELAQLAGVTRETANRILRRIGVWEDVMRARPAMLRGWRLTSPGHRSFAVSFADISDDAAVTTSLAIRRDRFDAVLLDHARAAGASVIHGAYMRELLRESAEKLELV